MNALEIRKKRKELKLTQSQLAEMLGVSLKTISNYEKGEVIPQSKKELLHKILNEEISNNLVSEPVSEYVKLTGYEKKIQELEERIAEIKEIIKLFKGQKPNEEKHYTEMIRLLSIQIELVKEARFNHENE